MLKIYIGYDFENNPTSVLLAKRREDADIAWTGMRDTPHYVEELDLNNENIGIHGTVFLLTSEKQTITHCDTFRKTYIIRQFKRGL